MPSAGCAEGHTAPQHCTRFGTGGRWSFKSYNLPGARAVLARFARCAPPMPPDPAPHAAKPRAASRPGAAAMIALGALPVAAPPAAPTFTGGYLAPLRRGDPGPPRVRRLLAALAGT